MNLSCKTPEKGMGQDWFIVGFPQESKLLQNKISMNNHSVIYMDLHEANFDLLRIC